MEVSIKYEKPEGFDEWFTKTLAKCVAHGIVEKAVRDLHKRDEESKQLEAVSGE